MSPEQPNVFGDMIREAKTECGGDRCVVTAGLVSECSRDPSSGDPLYDFLRGFGDAPLEGAVEDELGVPDPSAYAAVVGNALAQAIARKCIELGSERPSLVRRSEE
jgi:hypothetical protein